MRISWLIPLAALALAGCQAREPQAPGRPGNQDAAPPAATAPVPPPTLEPAPQTAAAPACLPAKAQAACPPAAKASVRRQRARIIRDPRPPARPQGVAQQRERAVQERRQVDIPPNGGYRYEELEDREIQRRYAERRYEAERYGRREDGGAYRHDDYHARDEGGWAARPIPRRPLPPPPRYSDDDRPHHDEGYRREDRYSGGHAERRRESHERHDGYAHGGGYERHEGYVRRPPHKPEIRREHREARLHGGVRRYEERSYEESSSFRESYRESGGVYRAFGHGGACCARPAEAAGRDANGFLTWPGKVPAIP